MSQKYHLNPEISHTPDMSKKIIYKPENIHMSRASQANVIRRWYCWISIECYWGSIDKPMVCLEILAQNRHHVQILQSLLGKNLRVTELFEKFRL